MTQSIVKRRLDYSAPAYFINEIELTVALNPTQTIVSSVMKVSRNLLVKGPLVLNGEQLELLSIKLDGVVFKEFQQSDEHLTIDTQALPNDSFVLEISNSIAPESNTSLEGLYLSDGAYCTQCEAEGFRKITYFIDRPDVLAVFTCHIIADNEKLKYLLSNGNKISDVTLQDGRRKVSWHDPHKKPCYLFALVAGDFDLLSDSYTTLSGRKVALEIFVEKGRKPQAYHALESLKKSMEWDETSFGLEYDLDIYMVVAVDFFNMGAMENKGLNVFNSKYVLAAPETATDQDYFNIEAIIAHEYFHNWTGNRVTCRDWFQLSLKEGLTVFRDQRFSADMFNPLSTRIDQVKVMKQHQFSEDAGPMSHPIRPDEVMEMNNFYTVTVYDKGAEVIRMLHTLLGEEGFRKGMDMYFERHDGQAVTCDDFVASMQDANNHDLSHFKKWYSQSGTPVVNVSKDPETANKFVFSQYTPPTADQVDKSELYIPIKLEFLSAKGEEISLDNDIFVLDTKTRTLTLGEAHKDAIPVLLADFSAPVDILYDYSFEDLLTILGSSKSDYSRWNASQQIYTMLVNNLYENADYRLPDDIIDKLNGLLESMADAHGVLAEILSVPSAETLFVGHLNVDPIKMDSARDSLLKQLSKGMADSLRTLYQSLCQTLPYAYHKAQINKRKLRNAILCLLANTRETFLNELISVQYDLSDNMTDKLGAINASQVYDLDLFNILMTKFEASFGHDAVVMDKWFSLHANTYRPDILSHLDLLSSHQQYAITNPNKARSLMGSFAFYNTKGFHAVDGSGYKYLTDFLLKLDNINPQVSSRIATALIDWKKFDVNRQILMKKQLGRLLNHTGLSKDLFEKVSKSLVSS